MSDQRFPLLPAAFCYERRNESREMRREATLRALRFACVRPVARLTRRDPEMALERQAEIRSVVVSEFVRDLLQRQRRRGQHVMRSTHSLPRGIFRDADAVQIPKSG